MRVSSAIAISAAIANQAMLPCPRGITMNAASSGPLAEPMLPPTWNTDCAKPWRPPDAMRATREDSGWNTEEPEPIRAAATSSIGKLDAFASSSRPVSVKPMPIASDQGSGWRSVQMPTSGCSSEAVSWKVRVIRPTWPKSSAKFCFSSG